MKPMVYLEGGYLDPPYVNMFVDRGFGITKTLGEHVSLVQFTGGSDVHPSYYGHSMHPESMCDIERDIECKLIFDEAQELGIPCAGICRGGQFLNVMCGGHMIQHVHNHAIWGTHPARFELNGLVEEIEVTSTHHQMMIPAGTGAEVIGYAYEAGGLGEVCRTPGTVATIELYRDTECVFYEDKSVLCFQPHPEIHTSTKACTDMYFRLLETKLNVKAA